jgi:DNA-binding HxlR family transcriptional regulator
MPRADLAQMRCSIARTLDVVGERWTLLVLRDAFGGVRRFEEFHRRLPIARNILADRLATLVEYGVLAREPYQERPPRHEYRLTDAGRELYPVLIALMQWGEAHLPPPPAPSTSLVHAACGTTVEAHVVCPSCAQTLAASETSAVVPG